MACTLVNTYFNSGTSGSTRSVASVVVGAGQSIAAYAMYNSTSSVTVTSVKWNTTEACSQVNSSRYWVLKNPTAGTHSVDLVLSGSPSGGCALHVWVVDSLDQTTVTRTATTGSTAPTSAVGDLVLGALTANFGDTNDWTANASATSDLDTTMNPGGASAAISCLAEHRAGQAGTTTMQFTHPTSDGNATAKQEFVALIGAAAGTTFYLLDSVASSSLHGQLQLGGSAPTAATTTTGWTVGANAVDTYALLAYGTEQPATEFGASALPSTGPNNSIGDCWRSASTITGQFAAGDWDLSFALRAVDQGGTQDGTLRIRLWRSTDPTGASATEITSGATQLTGFTDLSTSADGTATGTIALGAVTLEAEYLFVQVGYRVTGVA